MSFWEDRFVNRPHSGALPPDSHAEAEYAGPPQGSAYPQLPSRDEEASWSAEPYRQADEIGAAEVTDGDSLELGDEPAFPSDNGEEPVVEYRRKGLFRRRRAVAVAGADEAVDDNEAVAEEEIVSEDEVFESEPADDEVWSVVAEAEEASEDDPLVADPVENDDPAPAKKKHGLFRRKPAIVDEASVEAEEPLDVEADEEPEHSWHVPAVDSEPAELVAMADEDGPVDEPEPKRRGFFRRRKAAAGEETDRNDHDSTSVEDDAFASVSYWSADSAHENEESPAEDAETQLEEREDVLVYGQDESAADDEASAVEDASDENMSESEPEPVEVYASDESNFVPEPAEELELLEESQPAAYEPAAYEPPKADTEQMSTDGPEAVEPEPALVEPEVYALDDEPTSLDEPAPRDEQKSPELEPSTSEPEVFAFEEGPQHEEAEPEELFASHTESEDEVVLADEIADEEPAVVADADLEHESELEAPGADDWNSAGENHSEDESVDDVVAAPVPLKKRNGGGGSRGKKVVGLKVGASQLAAAVVSGSGERPALVDVARRPLEPGVVVGGELRDTEALVHALRTFFKENHLPTKNVRLGLSSSRVGVRTFEIAGVEDELRFDNAVRFKAHEVLPVAAHESLLDYRVVEERFTESGEVSRRVLLVVAPRDQIEPYVEACNQAGIRLAGVDLESFGLLRTFVPPFGSRDRTEDSATVVVSIGHEASTLLVAGGGICEFTRVFDWGGDALLNAIVDELEVPHMEAATILTHLSLSGPGRHLDSLDAEARSRALEAVRARLTPFARELVSSLQFYQTQPDSLGIREILITGGTAHLEGLADVLNQMIGVSVGVGDPLSRVEVQTEIPAAIDATIGSLAVPIGLAIEDESARSVNLLSRGSRQARKKPNALAVAVPLAAAIPVLALAFLFMQANGTVGERQAELDATRAEIDALPEPTKAVIDPALAGEQASRATAVAQILGGRLTWERVLGDVSRVLPAGVSLTELVATTPPPTAPVVATPPTEEATATEGATASIPAPAPAAAPTTPSSVTVTGYALDYPTIARTLERLQAVPSLTNVELQSAVPTTKGEKRIIGFTIVAVLATPGGVQ